VNDNVKPVRGRRQAGALAWLLVVGLMACGPRDSAAHEQLAACVQHRIHLTVGQRYIDLTLDLTFFEEWSAQERRAMDGDGNGRITRSESEAYLKRLAPALAQELKLRVAGRELDLAPLYEPELDLLGSSQTGPAHHRLRLWFFGSTPPALRAGDEIVVEDRLWPQAKALGTLQAEGRDGFALEASGPGDPGFAPARPGEARLFHARCLKAPLIKPGRPAEPVRKTRRSERFVASFVASSVVNFVGLAVFRQRVATKPRSSSFSDPLSLPL